MKFSIIVPIYNVEKYLKKCLESIKAQTYLNYEVLLIDDGSLDGSSDIAKGFSLNNKKFHYYHKANGGLSDARNYGLSLANGDYILFVDSDDFIEKDLLSELAPFADKEVDVIKFLFQKVDENNKIIYKEPIYGDQSVAYERYVRIHPLIEPAWSYAYRKRFLIANNLQYEKGRIHEDYGLTSYALALADRINSIPYHGYNYLVRSSDSITTDPSKLKKRMDDIIFFYDQSLERASQINEVKKRKAYLDRMSTGVFGIAKVLNGEDLNNFLIAIKKRKVYQNLAIYSPRSLIKYFTIKFSPELYVTKVLKR